MMLILGLFGMYFDAAVVFLTNSSLLFRLVLTILCIKVVVYPGFLPLFALAKACQVLDSQPTSTRCAQE